MRVVGGESIDLVVKLLNLESVDNGIDLLDLLLRRLQCFLFHDGSDCIAVFATFSNDSSIPASVAGLGGQDGHRRSLRQMEIANPADGRWLDQRNVTGEDEHVVI